jgi:hypothetical protein
MNNILETGSPIGEDEVASLEARLKFNLPGDYRAFLLRTNGGRPSEDTVDVPGLQGGSTDLQTFFGVSRKIETSNIMWNMRLVEDRLSNEAVVPIACDSGGELFCLRARSSGFEVVYVELAPSVPKIYVVAPNFNVFLQRLHAWKR